LRERAAQNRNGSLQALMPVFYGRASGSHQGASAAAAKLTGDCEEAQVIVLLRIRRRTTANVISL